MLHNTSLAIYYLKKVAYQRLVIVMHQQHEFIFAKSQALQNLKHNCLNKTLSRVLTIQSNLK